MSTHHFSNRVITQLDDVIVKGIKGLVVTLTQLGVHLHKLFGFLLHDHQFTTTGFQLNQLLSQT
ncbi:hypothetical protein D3C80_1842200 [compost metagenome]